MPQQTHVPQFGKWDTAQNVPYTQYFDQARRKKDGRKAINPNDPSENSGAHAKCAPSSVNAAPVSPGSNPETTKPKDARPMRRDGGNLRRTETPPVRSEVVAVRKSPAHPDYQQHVDQANHGDNQKRPNRNYAAKAAHNPPPSGRRIASEATPARIRKSPGDRTYATGDHDVAVPPFADWDENDPASGEKYTDIFKRVADNRRTPGTPYKSSQPSVQKQESTEPRGCGCLSWIL